MGKETSYVTEKYQFNRETGYFGVMGKSSNKHIRNMKGGRSGALEFFQDITKGSTKPMIEIGKGKYIQKLNNGTLIVYREFSSSDGTSVVEINRSPIYNYQKIHFID